MAMRGVEYHYQNYTILQYHQGTLLGGNPGFNSFLIDSEGNREKCCDTMHQWGSFSDVCAERKIRERNMVR